MIRLNMLPRQRCNRCRRNKPISLFHKNQDRCRDCQSEVFKAWRSQIGVAELRKERARKYARERVGVLEQFKARLRDDPRPFLVRHARDRCSRSGLPFDLVAEDLTIPDVCPALGIPLVAGGGRNIDQSPTLDRLVPEKGYVPGNVRVISWRANRIKCDATAEELQLIADYVRREMRLG